MAGRSLISAAGDSFSLTPRNLTEAMEYAKLIASSGICPTNYQGKPGDVLVAVQYGLELGLPPMQAVQSVAVINGKPSVYGDALLAVVQRSGLLESIEEFDASKAFTEKRGWCKVKRKGDPVPNEASFTWKDAELAKLIGKQGPWSMYPGRMLQMRARGFALRDKFADVLKGAITVEEAQDYEVVATQTGTSGERVDIMRPKRASATATAKPVQEPLVVVEAPPAEPTPPPGEAQSMPVVTPPAPPASGKPKISVAQRNRLFAIAHEAGRTDDEMKMHLREVYGLESSKDITTDIYETVCAWAEEGARAS